jgi:hypothetical protein
MWKGVMLEMNIPGFTDQRTWGRLVLGRYKLGED